MRLPFYRFSIAVICAAVLIGSARAGAGEWGKVIEHAKFYSTSLGMEQDYSVYLPPGYESSTRWYPVVYLLHGYSDDDDGWVRFGRINVIMDRLLEADEIPPMIIVMPDGKISWYVNSLDGKDKFEDMAAKDLVSHVDKTYRTLTDRMNRGISGLSMGGYGSLQLAMRNPDIFSIVGALSSGVMTDEEIINLPDERYERLFHGMFGSNLAGVARLSPHYKAYNPIDLAATLPMETMKRITWYIACGDDDFLIAGNQELNRVMRSRQIPHEYRVYEGVHSWPFWREHIVEVLKMMGKQFGR